MADTMNFGPEWLRALADGPHSGTGSSASASGTKPKLAEHRYGREEILTLFQKKYEPPPVLSKFPHIYVAETQSPMALRPFSEDEERLIAQGVNSQMVMRPGRGGQLSLRGARGGMIVDRGGRARGGKGRGEIYSRASLENGDIGFHRSRGPNKDGWEEVGHRKLDRGFSRQYEDPGRERESRENHPRFNRSMSDNWREKNHPEDDDEGDWRKPVTRERWTRWREPVRGGHELEPRRGDREGGFPPRGRGLESHSEDRGGRRLDVPEWIDDGTEDVGSFDASGAFVSNREPPYYLGSKEPKGEQESSVDPQMDPDRPEGGSQQQRREPDGWESSDSGQELGTRGSSSMAPAVGSHGSGGGSNSSSSREDAGPPAGRREDEREAGLNNEMLSSSGLRTAAVRDPFPSPALTDLAAAAEVTAAAPTATNAVEEEALQQQTSVPVVPVTHENALKWYYVDPQETLQGPFSSEDMSQWFGAGYFTMGLRVKRGCDEDFQPLGDLLKTWGQIPFQAVDAQPPLAKPQRPASPPDPLVPKPIIHTTTPTPAPNPTPIPTLPNTLPNLPNATPTNPNLSNTNPHHPALSLTPPVVAAAAAGAAPPMAASALPSSSTLPSSSSSFPLGVGVGAPGGGGGGGAGGTTHNLLMQQQLLIQHQILQLQVEYRQQQMQTLSQLQEQEDFKALDPAQQQRLSLIYMHNNPVMQQNLQTIQQLQAMLQQTQQTQQQLQLLASTPSQPQPGGGAGVGNGLETGSAGTPSAMAAVPVPPASSSNMLPASMMSLPSLPQQPTQPLQQQQQQQQQHQQPLPSAVDLARSSSSPKFNLAPATQPTATAGESQGPGQVQGQGDIPSIWGSGPPAGWPLGQPTSVWELENHHLPPSDVGKDLELEKLRKEKEEFARQLEEERKKQEEIQKQHEEMRREAEAMQRKRERLEREKEELERQRIRDLQRVEELRRQKEEEQRCRELEEEQRRKQREEEALQKLQAEERRRREAEEEAEMQRKREELQRRKEDERKRAAAEKRKKQEEEEEERKRREELKSKREAEEMALQELKRMEETRQQMEAEKQRQRELEKKQEAEAASKKKDWERQQQEALRRMQQQQNLKNMQLPSAANWARQQQQQQGGQSVQSRSLAEIQQEEEMRQAQQEKERQQQIQRQQLEQQQLQLQQQQKTWASNRAPQQTNKVKTLAEIQEEQERQLRQEKQKTQQQQSYQAKTLSLAQAAAWPSSSPFSSSSSPISSLSSAQPPSSSSLSSASTANPWNSGSNSLWGTTTSSSIWGNGNPAPAQSQKSSGKKSAKENSGSQASSEFPSLHSQQSNRSKQAASRPSGTNSTASAKPKKEEAAVQRIFKEREQSKDEFTMWCEAVLEGMDVQVDIETFVSFLREVDSPYEVHDYVKSYLGESAKARQFAKDFLTKRSQLNNKARKEKQQEEESIWGPAPALNPREIRGNTVQTANTDHGGGFTEVGGKSKGGKKKKKMQKLDNAAMLGFTVAKDPNRKNAGEIETVD